jgi:hypothetical protein
MQSLRILILIILVNSIGQLAKAQDTLPSFTVKNRSGKIIVSWTNNYPAIRQISIQRSSDSANGFRSILTVPDPKAITNGYLDSRAPDTVSYYRLFLLLDSSHYVFTSGKKAVRDTIVAVVPPPPPVVVAEVTPQLVVDTAATVSNTRVINQANVERDGPKMKDNVKTPFKDKPLVIETTIYIKRRDSVIGQITDRVYKRFKDSVLTKTKDTLVIKSFDTIVIKPVYRPSQYVFTDKDGNVVILLGRISDNKYAIKFFDEDNSPLFELQDVKESPLTLEKINFQHAGWFYFELYENETLKERHKFFIPRDKK